MFYDPTKIAASVRVANPDPFSFQHLLRGCHVALGHRPLQADGTNDIGASDQRTHDLRPVDPTLVKLTKHVADGARDVLQVTRVGGSLPPVTPSWAGLATTETSDSFG